MFHLIIGSKGSGKTKTLIEQANAATRNTNGDVVCIEKGDKLKFDITHEVRLIDTESYGINDGQALFGFVCGIVASNHDITDIFIDSTLKICRNDLNEFEVAAREIATFIESNGLNCLMTASLPAEELPAGLKVYVD